MKTYVLSYQGYKHNFRINLGDEIQSIAAMNLLPSCDGMISREALNEVQEKCIVSLNGFFMSSSNWPPSDKVIPIPFAFHIAKKSKEIICSPQGLEYLKRYQPIGCRDQGTAEILQKHGLTAYFSRCVTLTLPKRPLLDSQNKVCIVGLNPSFHKLIPHHLKKNAVIINQSNLHLPLVTPQQKMQLAENLLDFYKNHASLVITQKIHCAMPCIAMGIPVIFLWDSLKKNDYRIKTLDGLCKIHYVNPYLAEIPLLRNFISRKIDWNPKIIDIEPIKKTITKNYLEAYKIACERFAEN